MSMEQAQEVLASLQAEHREAVAVLLRRDLPLMATSVLLGTVLAGFAAGALRVPALWGGGAFTMLVVAAALYPRRPTLHDAQFALHIDGLTEAIQRRRVELNRLERAEEARRATGRGECF